MNKIEKTLGVLALMMVLLVSSVSAFAISNPYWRENPLIISPGESAKATLVLNNGGGATESMVVSCSIIEGADLAMVTSAEESSIPAGGKASVDVQVSIPSNASLGAKTIKLSCRPISPENTAGPVGIGQAIDQTVYLLVVEKQAGEAETEITETETSNLVWYVIIGLLILIILLAIVFSALKKKK
jgi:hypothetical protein